MSDKDGTPKTLDEALNQAFIEQALAQGPLVMSKDKAYWVLRDYLAQRFGAAMLKYPSSEDILKELFEEITEHSFKAGGPKSIEDWKKS
jgi:hypothetical protein